MSWGVALRNAVGLGLGGIPSLRNAPSLRAALDFNFLSGLLDPRITFSRTSNATLIGSDGTLQYAPHNLLTYSEQFDNAAWTKAQSTITSNSVVAPDGTTTADKLVEDATSATHFTSQAYSNSNVTLTFSIYIKAAERSIVRLQLSNNSTGAAAAFFDASSGVISSAASDGGDFTGSTATITSVGNGWYRCSLTTLKGAVNTTAWPYVTLVSSGTTTTYLGNGTSGIYVWGAQLNVGALQPYYSTVASAYYGPRFDYDPVTLAAKGLLIEEQRTNSIRNNTAQGAVAGTPGTLPTNWFIGNLAGLSTQVVAIGTESGVSYIDLRIFGTSTTTNFILNFEPTTQIPALQNQSWTGSFFVTYVAGTLTNVQNFSTTITERNSAGALLSTSTALRNLTNTPLIQNRYVNSYTLPTATAAYVTLRLDVGVAATSAIDITLRIGLPQLELGAFATSVIPTTTAAATRAADVASVTGANFSSWYNQTEGTFYFEGSIIGSTGADQIGLNANNAAFTERVRLGRVSNTARFTVVDDGVVQADLTGGTWAVNAVKKLAGAYAVNSIALSVDGATPLVDTAATIPTPTQLQIGNEQLATYLNGHIRSFKYYPTRLSNSQLQSLTFVPLLWTPAQIPTALWLDAADASTITLNGSTVSQWNDKSGNGRNATQATAANQPTYNPTGFSGKPSLVFDGVNDDLRSTAPDGNTFAVYWVGFGSTNVTTPGQPWFNAPFFSKVFRVGGLFKSGASGQFQVGDYDGADKSVVVPYVFNTPAIFEASKGSGLLTARLNGDVSNTTSIGNSGGFPGIKLGTNYNDTIFLEHTVGEYVHCNEPLSTTDRQKLEGYLAWKWGLQANLPVGHPYKAAAPTV